MTDTELTPIQKLQEQLDKSRALLVQPGLDLLSKIALIAQIRQVSQMLKALKNPPRVVEPATYGENRQAGARAVRRAERYVRANPGVPGKRWPRHILVNAQQGFVLRGSPT